MNPFRTAACLILIVLMYNGLQAQFTPWDIIYCLNGGENKSAGIPLLTEPNPPQKAGWTLLTADEFDGPGLDSVKWNRSTPWDDSNGTCKRGFAENPDNIEVIGGQAQLFNTLEEALPGCPYSFGHIKTMSIRDSGFSNYYFYAPGYLETRVKLFNKTGQGAACWLWAYGLPGSPGIPGPWNEIDLFELNGVNGNQFNATYHWQSGDRHVSQVHRIYLLHDGLPYDLTENWTIFGLEWDTASIRWFVNNQLVKEMDLTAIPPYCIASPNYIAPDAPFCVRLNTGNNAVGNQSAVADPGDFPQTMLVDYVRMYKKSGYPVSPVTLTDGISEICADAISPETSGKYLLAAWYPGAVQTWSSPAFEFMDAPFLIPQPPGKKKIWIKPGIEAGHAYPVTVQTDIPGNYSGADTIYIYIAPGIPGQPQAALRAVQVDTLCRYALEHTLAAGSTGCDFSLDGGVTWQPAILRTEGDGRVGLLGNFKPEEEVGISLRESNICGISPTLSMTYTLPPPPQGCSWPAGSGDTPGAASSGFLVSPNPATDAVTIRSSPACNVKPGNTSWTITDLSGRALERGFLGAMETVVPVNHLAKGIYVLLIHDAATPPVIFKLIRP